MSVLPMYTTSGFTRGISHFSNFPKIDRREPRDYTDTFPRFLRIPLNPTMTTMFCFEFKTESMEGPSKTSLFSAPGRTPAEALKSRLGSPEVSAWARSLFTELGFKVPPSPTSITEAAASKESPLPELATSLLELADGSIDTMTLEALLEELVTSILPEDSSLHELRVWRKVASPKFTSITAAIESS